MQSGWHINVQLYLMLLKVIMGIFCLIIQGPHDPHHHPCLLYPVLECLDVLLLLQDSDNLQGEEDLMKIKTKDILFNELSELMSTTLRCTAYLIFTGHARCLLTSNIRWYRGIMIDKSSDAWIPNSNNIDVCTWGMASGSWYLKLSGPKPRSLTM